jgi:tetratricopeptide (TPR) repeat protein
MSGHRPLLALMALLLVAVATTWVSGSLGEVADLFRHGRYGDAREALAAEPDDAKSDAANRMWRQRLETEPDQAFELALDQVRDRQLPASLRLQAALDGAANELARQHPEAAWQLLEPLIGLALDEAPGELYLLAGRTLRAAGDRQRAREMLASVRPDDPSFAAARELLGRIGLESGDSELALNYFESAQRRLAGAPRPDLLAGRWHALRMLGRDVEARDVADELVRDHPSSLAAMEVAEQRRRDDEALAALADTTDVEAPALVRESTTDRYAVQLAAFRDRALALQFVARWQTEIPELRVVRQPDDLGQPIYRIQTGSFVSRALARSEVARIAREHGLEGFVSESGD